MKCRITNRLWRSILGVGEQPILVLDNLSVSYGESRILRDVSLTVPSGQIACLLGRNGVGKTTTLKSIVGLLRPTEGSVNFDGANVNRWVPEKRTKRGIGYVPQGRDIFSMLTVEENLMIGLQARPRGKGNEIPREIYDLFPVLQSMLGRAGGDLSGGQQQQLAIARALVGDPRLLLLDEPTEGIQPSVIQEIEQTIMRLKQQGTVSILLVEQYLEFAWRLADLYYVMEKGAIVSQGLTKDLDEATVKKHLTV